MKEKHVGLYLNGLLSRPAWEGNGDQSGQPSAIHQKQPVGIN